MQVAFSYFFAKSSSEMQGDLVDAPHVNSCGTSNFEDCFREAVKCDIDLIESSNLHKSLRKNTFAKYQNVQPQQSFPVSYRS